MEQNRIKNSKKIILSLFAVSFGIFATASILNMEGYHKINTRINTAEVIATENSNEEQNTPSEKYFYFTKDENLTPKIGASAYIVGDLDTGEIILAKNQNEVYPIASVSKLMTALVSSEISKEGDVALASSKALSAYGSNGNFRLNEKVKITDLYYPLLLESSNDAAEMFAETYDHENFIRKMNQEAEKLKMTKTSYEDPSGLSPHNTSTTEDLFKLAGYLHRNKPELLEKTTKKSFSNKKHTWFSNNQFLQEDGYIGGKSGYTDKAKETVISMFDLPMGQIGTRPIGITLLQSDNRQKDVQSILKYLKKNVYYGGQADATADWIKEKLGVPDLREPDYVDFVFLGDIMLDRGVRNSVNRNFNGDYSMLFDKMGILKKQDIVFANLEGVASDKGKDLGNLYSFRMDPSVIPALSGSGIDILSVANNHIGDWGREAYIDTLARLEENEIHYTGGGLLSKVEHPTIINQNGMKIGFLGFSDKGPNYMQATEDNIGILLASNPRFDEIIANASKEVDYLVVSFHFGEEYQKIHNKRQEVLAHRAIDNGAKIVIGHHPHMIEDTEVYKSGFIAYSLGNFIFDQRFSVDTMQGMMLELRLRKDGSISIKKDIVKLNSIFQPDKIIIGKEEKIKFKK